MPKEMRIDAEFLAPFADPRPRTADDKDRDGAALYRGRPKGSEGGNRLDQAQRPYDPMERTVRGAARGFRRDLTQARRAVKRLEIVTIAVATAGLAAVLVLLW